MTLDSALGTEWLGNKVLRSGKFADLHIHIGSAKGKAVKITASRLLTLRSIIFDEAPRKGIDIVGVVDAGSRLVASEIEEMLSNDELQPLSKGGFLAINGVLLIAGCEVETREGFHVITYLPSLDAIHSWQRFLRNRVRNLELSTQRVDAGIVDLVALNEDLGGIFCPAHAFTPHKGVYGMWTDKLASKIGTVFHQIKVLELGLSADTDMADCLAETGCFTFVSNSDAHSAGNIGREYNQLLMHELNFAELRWCLENRQGRKVIANYGMHPLMGKYHRTYCPACDLIATEAAPVLSCGKCGTDRIVLGVKDRLVSIQDIPETRHPNHRPPYYYRIPLKDLPGIGPTIMTRLKQAVVNEIELIERTPIDELEKIAGPKVAATINDMRMGRLAIQAGGGGKYGKVKR